VASRRYENFDLLIEEEHGGYQARVTACPSNETPSTRFVLPFDETKLENLLLKLDPGRTDMRRGPGDAREVASKELGGALYSAVFTEDIRDAWTRSLEQVQARDCGLRLRLKLTDAPSLAGLPWELLYSVRTNRYPAQSESTPVIRFLGDRGTSKAQRVEGPLTILFVICSPTDLPDLDTENEWRAVQQELKPLIDRDVVRLERLPDPATPARLLDRLSDGPVHIVHFVGHGDFDEASQEGVVYFCTNYSTKNPIGADRLGSVLQDVEELKLVVLNACQSARGDSHDVFGGMAQGLVQFSVSAVAAMQFPISDKAASTFSRSLYRAIARGNPVDQAIASARKAILMAYPSEWATPVLYLRTNDGVIFDLTREVGNASAESPGEPPPPEDPRRRWTRLPGARRALAIGAAVVVMLVLAYAGLQYYIYRQTYDNLPRFSSPTSPSLNYFSALSGPAVDAHRLGAPPVLDGSAEDWSANITPVSSDDLVQGSATNVRATWRLGWDHDWLYVFADVTDPQLTQIHGDNAQQISNGDAVAIEFGSSQPHTLDEMEWTDHVLVFAPIPPGRQIANALGYRDAAGQNYSFLVPMANVDGASKITSTGYTIEARMPLRTIDLADARGAMMGLNLYVIDAASTGPERGQRRSKLSNNSALAEVKDPGSARGRWGTMTLRD
jgi:hypothetical protein